MVLFAGSPIDKAGMDMDCALFSHLSPALEIYGVWTLPRWLEPLKLKRIHQLPLLHLRPYKSKDDRRGKLRTANQHIIITPL